MKAADREALRLLLEAHLPASPREAESRDLILRFLAENPEALGRENPAGHLTGSAWVLNRQGDRALLTHHAKLGVWLQPGGHLEGDESALEASLREAREETGLASLRLALPGLFDVDVHLIPARPGAGAHLHYDLRFLLVGDGEEPLVPSEESRDLCWFDLERLAAGAGDESVRRMAAKSLRPSPSPREGGIMPGTPG
ncbi:MAG: NUDIX hydrolase [Spirochaetaceae bacterium]|nr:NUDIX hydrolase [Spirochaetaceae bacterium]